MSAPHCEDDNTADAHGLDGRFSPEASAVLHPPAGTASDRLSGPQISVLARLMGALEQPVSEPGEEGYPANYELDADGWGDAIEADEPAYLDPAEVLAIEAQRLANVRHTLAAGEGLTADDIARLTEEEGNLIADCTALVAELLGGEK